MIAFVIPQFPSTVCDFSISLKIYIIFQGLLWFRSPQNDVLITYIQNPRLCLWLLWWTSLRVCWWCLQFPRVYKQYLWFLSVYSSFIRCYLWFLRIVCPMTQRQMLSQSTNGVCSDGWCLWILNLLLWQRVCFSFQSVHGIWWGMWQCVCGSSMYTDAVCDSQELKWAHELLGFLIYRWCLWFINVRWCLWFKDLHHTSMVLANPWSANMLLWVLIVQMFFLVYISAEMLLWFLGTDGVCESSKCFSDVRDSCVVLFMLIRAQHWCLHAAKGFMTMSVSFSNVVRALLCLLKLIVFFSFIPPSNGLIKMLVTWLS